MDITNMGGDTPLHAAAQHGHRDIVAKVCLIESMECDPNSLIHGTDVTSTASH